MPATRIPILFSQWKAGASGGAIIGPDQSQAGNPLTDLIPVNGAHKFGMQIIIDNNGGGFTTLVVALQGSMDGVTFMSTALLTWTSASQSSGDIVWVADKPVWFVQANITTY